MLNYSIRRNSALISDIESYFNFLDEQYIQGLSAQVAIGKYLRKLSSKAKTLEIWTDLDSVERLDALLAYYINTAAKEIFVTHFSVRKDRNGLGFGTALLQELTNLSREDDAIKNWRISLEVKSDNFRAINLYKKFNFSICGQNRNLLQMERLI